MGRDVTLDFLGKASPVEYRRPGTSKLPMAKDRFAGGDMDGGDLHLSVDLVTEGISYGLAPHCPTRA